MYYHVSKKDLGEEVVFQPRIPGQALLSEEGDIPRICVSDRLFYCLRSIVSGSTLSALDILFEFRSDIEPFESSEDWLDKEGVIHYPTVYICQDIPYSPPAASDFRKNNERWYLTNKEFTRIGYIDLSELVKSGTIVLVTQCGFVSGAVMRDPGLKDLKIINKKHIVRS